MKLSKVAVIFTGGTISMAFDERIGAVVPSTSNEQIFSAIDELENQIEIETIDFANIPGPHVTISIMVELKKLIEKTLKRNDIRGVVITHGTDTLEETAYFLDLTVNSTKPVAVTGAMKSSSEIGCDGPSNLLAAIYTVISPEAVGQGVMIIMNNTIHAAREATKIDTFRLNSFVSVNCGPLGIVDGNKVVFQRKLDKRNIISASKLESNVVLIKCSIGMDSDLLRYYVDRGTKGIIIEAFGRGNIPPMMVEGVQYALNRKIPVVIASRCLTGRVLDIYGYQGGGKQLRELGAIFAGQLSGQKALIKLMLVLGLTDDLNEIREYFH